MEVSNRLKSYLKCQSVCFKKKPTCQEISVFWKETRYLLKWLSWEHRRVLQIGDGLRCLESTQPESQMLHPCQDMFSCRSTYFNQQTVHRENLLQIQLWACRQGGVICRWISTPWFSYGRSSLVKPHPSSLHRPNVIDKHFKPQKYLLVCKWVVH